MIDEQILSMSSSSTSTSKTQRTNAKVLLGNGKYEVPVSGVFRRFIHNYRRAMGETIEIGD